MDYCFKGRVLKYGDNINTDNIAPSPYGHCSKEVMVAHAMEGVDPEFHNKVKPGDILVVGKNFGSGSSRETAPFVLKESGVAAIIGKSFARIFFRNAINIGLPLLISEDTDLIQNGDILELNVLEGLIEDIIKGKKYSCSRLPENLLTMLADGGLIPHLLKNKVP